MNLNCTNSSVSCQRPPMRSCSLFVNVLTALLFSLSSFAAYGQGRPDIVWSHGGHRFVTTLEFTSDGLLVSSGENVKIIRLSDNMLLHTFDVYNFDYRIGTAAVRRLAHGKSQVVTVGQYNNSYGELQLWDVATGKLIRTQLLDHPILPMSTGPPPQRLIGISPDGNVLALLDPQPLFPGSGMLSLCV